MNATVTQDSNRESEPTAKKPRNEAPKEINDELICLSESSSNHAVSATNNDSLIYLNAKFASFEEFRVALEDWMQRTYQPFRIASSETLKHCGPTVNEAIVYRYLVYHCACYGNPRKRGHGMRPNQHYIQCGCTATIRVNYSFEENCLKITTFKIDHNNHVLSAARFREMRKN
ncbi:hypothetical protein PENTCL1PPCAC_27490, partial [Pristionchus entomophagus]